MKFWQFVVLVANLLVISPIESAVFKKPSKFYHFPQQLTGINRTAADEVSDFAEQYNDVVDMGLDIYNGLLPLNLRMALANATLSDDPATNQVNGHFGLLRLRSAIAKLYSPLIGQKLHPKKNIVVTSGATGGVYSAIMGHTTPGDEWIVIEPAYTIYRPMIKMANGIVRGTTLKLSKRKGRTNGDDWVLDKEELASLFNEKTRGIVLNNPNNPTGKVYTADELQYIAELVIKHDAIVVTDEAHDWITYNPHVRIASLPGMFERTISVGSATKTFSVSGWRIGWAYGSEEMINNVKTVQKASVYFTPTTTEIALAYGFEEEIRNFGSPKSYIVTHREQLLKNRDSLYKVFLNTGMHTSIPDGGCCFLVDWSPLKDRLPKEIRGATDFAKWLITNIGLLGFPVTTYYSEENRHMAEDYLRFCFNKKYENLVEAARRLKTLKQKLIQH